MAFAANDLKIILFNNWNLAGELSKNPSDNMKEPIAFFSRPQIEGNELTKAVEVVKVESAENENVEVHPKFTTKTDIYKIKVRFRLVNTQDDNYIDQLSLVEDMTDEVTRIITNFFSDPSALLGTFSTVSRQWAILDQFRSGDPEIIRELTLRLTGVFSEEPKVFRGFGGTLAFDASAYSGDDPPAGDYLYTEAFNIRLTEGFTAIPVLTNDLSRGIGVPELMRGMFRGKFAATMYLKSDDVDGSDDSKLNRILLPQNNGDLPEVTFLHGHTNSVPQTLTTTTVFKVTNIIREETTDGLVQIRLEGDLVKPTLYAIT
ncbi:hypothetical protein KAR91_03435 [Candidatus Pacearchaeota archaeon]|nr:hypothetical protein [Candidatus Pacearchaeota archaeon]